MNMGPNSKSSRSFRTHGGPDSAGVALHDFSSNGNGCGPCPYALAAVQAADATRYPDPAYAALRARLAAFHGVAPGRVVLAGSGSEFIFRFTAWAAGQGARTVSLPRPGYGDYAQAAIVLGLRQVAQPGEAQLAWACEPSSPLGGPHPGLEDLAASGGLIVLDRAYEPLRLSGRPTLDASGLDRIWQLWTPNKALGLTGVRAAYAIAPADTGAAAIGGLEALASSWPIGAHGVAMLLAWCEPDVQQWLGDSRELLRKWKARQVGVSESLGWACLPGHANFMVCRAADGTPAASPITDRLDRLRGHGVKLRDCASFGLPGHLRLSVQSPASQDALRRAWDACA